VADRLVVDVSDLPPGGLREVTIGDRAVLLCNAGGSFHAIENRCPHAPTMGAPSTYETAAPSRSPSASRWRPLPYAR
jgi:nitrite reductase/ring-hydroxylating ferredoxin subunit